MNARCFVLSYVLLAGCPSVDPRPGITLATSYQDDTYARTLLGRSILDKDGQLPDSHLMFRATDEVKSTPVGGNYTNDQKLVKAIKASFKGTIKKSCGATANALIGSTSDSDIDIEWKQVLEALDNQRAYEESTELCADDGNVVPSYKDEGVITTVFKTKMTLHSNQSGGLVIGTTAHCNLGSTGAQGDISISVSGDGRTTITSDGWNFVKVEAVASSCRAWHRHHVRAMSDAQKKLLQSVASQYSKALLDSYQCHWMFGGVLVMDKICPAGQCPGGQTPLGELRRLYSMPVGQLAMQYGDTICSSIKQTMKSLGTSGDFLEACNNSAIISWVERHQDDTFYDITRRTEVSAQIDLLRSILSPQSRSEVSSAWAKLPQAQDFFRSASRQWGQLQDQCAPGGCTVHIVIGDNTAETFTTLASWPSIRDKLFASWLNVFSGEVTTGPDFRAGCHGAVMQLEGSSWRYKGTGNQTCAGHNNCLSFGDPSDTDQASNWFATEIVK